MNEMDQEQLAAHIDHTLLDPTAGRDQIAKLCGQAVEYGFFSVCVNPRWVSFAADRLANEQPRVCSVISFPFGADGIPSKVQQAKCAIMDGAAEIDMVADLSSIIARDEKHLAREFKAVLKVCRSMEPPVSLKVIIEAAALEYEQKVFACRTAELAGVDFIKTSTGTHQAGGATVEDVRLIRQTAPRCRVKAAGGIRTTPDCRLMLQAGADRIGTSRGVKIIRQLTAEQ